MDRLGSFLVRILVVLVVFVTLIGFGWPGNWSPKSEWVWAWDYNRQATVKDFLRVRGFEPNARHAVCSVEKVNDGQSYKLTINRSNGCRKTVEIIWPATKVVRSVGDVARTSAVFSYNRHVFYRDRAEDGVMDWRSPNTGGKKSTVAWVRSLSLGELLRVDLRIVTLRIPPKASVVIIEEG